MTEFKLELFYSLDDIEQQQYLNSFDEDKIKDIFESISLKYLNFLDDIHLLYIFKDYKLKVRILNLVSSFISGTSIFNQLINRMNREQFVTFFNEETFDFITNEPKMYIILQAIINSSNSEILNFLPDTKLMEYLIKNYGQLTYVLENISKEMAIFFFEYTVKYYPEFINIINGFNSNNQINTIKYIGLYNFYNLVKDTRIFLDLDDDVITILISEEPFYSYFLNLDIEDISNLFLRGVILPDVFSNSKRLSKKISTIDDPSEYRLLVNCIGKNSFNKYKRRKWKYLKSYIEYAKERNRVVDSFYERQLDEIKGILDDSYLENLFSDSFIESERELYYDKQVNSISSNDNLLPLYYDEYKNNKHSYDYYYELTTKRLFEIFIDRYYKDITYNFILNLSNIVNFYSSTNNYSNDIKERLITYKKILTFNELSREEQIELYDSYDKNKDYCLEFYNDFNCAKTLAYTEYNNSVFNTKKDIHLLNKDLTEQYGIDVYEFKGEEFYLYSHVTSVKRNDTNQTKNIWQYRVQEYLKELFINENKTLGISLSLSNYKKLNMFRSVWKYITFGFNKLNPKRIAHVYHGDSYSAYYNNGVGMNKINEIYTLEQLMDMTCKYNEILYQEISNIVLDDDVRQNYEELVPDYLICYDDISYWDVNIGLRMEIPILLIHTKYYDNEKEDYQLYQHTNEYVTNLTEIKNIKSYFKNNK